MTITSVNPVDGTVVGTVPETSPDELRAVLAAASAAVGVGDTADRVRWMTAVADALDARAADLIPLADQESGLGHPRLTSELGRTTGQLRFLAGYAASGQPFEPTIDTADPGWTPTPRSDLRSIKVGIGVALVFAASNFPFAFSVAGGDTASAWAAGCPVVVKAHPGHALLSEAVGQAVRDALTAAGAPEGFFALVHGFEAGVAALAADEVAVGAFTGSVAGGTALHAIAAGRERPIPFFAEMGSVNPVVVTERAARERAESIAEGLAGSFLLGAGQFCTKPGLVIVPADSDLPERLTALVTDRPAPVLLHHGIRDRHATGIMGLLGRSGVELAGTGQEPPAGDGAHARITVASTTAATLLADVEGVTEEHFGPSTVFVTYSSAAELRAVLAAVPGSLTGTVHRGADEDIAEVVALLARRAGRVVVDEWPTGVAVTWAQFHGGPHPATTDARFTSVGAGAITRFLRPVAYQNTPADALPIWLRDANPDGIVRRVDGVLTTAAVN
ncbi:MAG TPA: aldehyde dehydrogenase family protein [Actinokineospora sp.]|nr:aldehyde dehydrogenase family protein [Actinokineospora sp.]